MKDNTVYLLYNTNASNVKLQNQPFKKDSIDWEYTDEDKFTIIYNPEDVRKSTEIKIHSKTKLRDRPKSAGEVMLQPKIKAEGILIKKSSSLSNIEDFFFKRRMPLIKPLFSEREIIKLQLLQAQCRKKRTGIESDKIFLQNFDVKEDKDPKTYKGIQPDSEEEKSNYKTKDETSPLLRSNVKSRDGEKRQGDKGRKESEEGKKIQTPASGKGRHEEAKKLIKHLSFDKSKSHPEKGKKKEKQETSKKEKLETSKEKKQEPSKKEKQAMSSKENIKSEKAPKGEEKSGKNKAKSLSESELKTTKSDAKTKDHTKPSKSKEKNKSEEKISGEDMKHEGSDKGGSKGSSKRASKQKLQSELSEKDVPSKRASKHSKDRTSQGKKSDKSDKSESGKSRKMSESSKKKKEKSEGVKEQDVKDKSDKFDKSKPRAEDSQDRKRFSDDVAIKSDVSKGDKKRKSVTSSERTSDPLVKEKHIKTDAKEKLKKVSGGKSVKFPSACQHIIHYVLSNPLFVKLGWTLEPSDRAKLQAVTFRAIPSHPHMYCFRERTVDEIQYYCKTLEKVAFHFRTDGTGEIFYPSGVLAATLTQHRTGMRLTLYSDPKNDPLITDSFNSKVLAIFDSHGNGVVYDKQRKKLLNFNQLEGIFYSPHRKSPTKWQWCDYKILEKERIKALLRYIAKEQKQPVPRKKSPTPSSGSPKRVKLEEKKPEVDEAYEQILAELPCPVPQKTKTKCDCQFWGFKPIILKINSEMNLRINGQDDVTVSFSSNQIYLRIDLGVKVDPDVVERIEPLAQKPVSDVPCVFDELLELSPSLQQLAAGSTKRISKNKLSMTSNLY